MARSEHTAKAGATDASGTASVAKALIDLVSQIPPPQEPESDHPDARIRPLVRQAQSRAALASGSLSLPPGPMGWLTLLPEIYAVWRIQAQMVSDLAALHGRSSTLSREQMLYCLFRHTGAQLFRDLVMRVGERYVVQRIPLRTLYAIAHKIGLRITRRSLGRAISRVVPVAGALGVAAYSWYDTGQVARTAVQLFRREVAVVPPGAARVHRRADAVDTTTDGSTARGEGAKARAAAGNGHSAGLHADSATDTSTAAVGAGRATPRTKKPAAGAKKPGAGVSKAAAGAKKPAAGARKTQVVARKAELGARKPAVEAKKPAAT